MIASVFLEKMFHSSSIPGAEPPSIWLRNIQLGLYAIPIQMVVVYKSDWPAVQADGLFQGFGLATLMLVGIQGPGGLLVALVIKYAGNMPKAFATAVGIVLTTFISMYVFVTFSPTMMFWVGVGVVAASILMYAIPAVLK